jgi:hypothetical protein
MISGGALALTSELPVSRGPMGAALESTNRSSSESFREQARWLVYGQI